MKKIIQYIILFSLISCGKSTYYVYDVCDINRYNYCTLEITSKNEVIYRATSDSYSLNNIIYTYIYSAKKSSIVNEDFISFACNQADFYYIKNSNNFNYINLPINVFGENKGAMGYTKKGKDTIITNINTERDLQYFQNDIALKKSGFKWYPSYMVKVDKIDYSRFPKSIQHMNLKDPRKEKKR